MDEEKKHSEPLDIEVFLPHSVELIDHDSRDTWLHSRNEPRQFRSRKRLALLLFLATCVSTFYVGINKASLQDGLSLAEQLSEGLTFSVSLMLILLCHEMGHYLQARRYGVPATPPFFIPMPFGPFGTMGAVIVQGAGIANRKQMFDIAISGPLAGLVLALPIAYFGLQTSRVVPFAEAMNDYVYGVPLIVSWMMNAMHGPLDRGYVLQESPMFFAGWVGIFITALNLIPIGQLDGGHILYTLIRRRAHTVAIALLWATIAFMLVTGNYSYLLIVVLLVLFGPRHPATADDRVPLGLPRIILGWLTLSFIVIGFTPTPIIALPGDLLRLRDELPPVRESIDPDELVREGMHPQIAQISPTGNNLVPKLCLGTHFHEALLRERAHSKQSFETVGSQAELGIQKK